METERGHVSVKRGVSWSPGGVRKPLQVGQDADTSFTESDASSERRDYMEAKGQPAVAPCTNQMAHKTSLTRSASLSEKELKEARVRSQIIAAQLTVPSNSNSRGVQLFNRRKQRVNAFTLQGGGGAQGSGREEAENEKGGVPPLNNLTWAARASEGKDRELNCKNSASKPPCAPGRLAFRGSDIMEDPGEPILEVEPVPEDSIIQERHFQPVNEKEEEEEEVKQQEVKEEREEVPRELEGEVGNESAPQSDRATVQREPVQGDAGMNGVYTEPVPPGHLPNGCHSSQGPGKVSVSLSRQAPAIVNRTARPFFSPATVRSPEARSPVAEIPPAPSYSTPPLPLPRPVAFSPPPPPPSYPTPPLPAFTSQPPQSFSGPPPMSTITSPAPPPPACQYAPPPACQYAPPSAPAVSRYVPPAPRASQHAPPTAPRPSAFVPRPSAFVPRPSTFVPQPSAFVPRTLGEWRPQSPIKSGILEEGAAKRGTRKSMFTFKEKPVVAPNPELLSLVQGADERKKQGPRSAPEPVSEEELLALGAEASNFLTRQLEAGAEDDAAPEWSSTLRSSSTRARAEHKPEQNLTNVSGKGAELFAKRQSRMEKFVLESQNAGQTRSPSPTMSLPPSWVYPSNMPGRVKAIANNSNISEQLTRTMKAQQPVQKKPVQRAPAPPPVSPPLENGCTKIEMELSKHQPYQLNSSLFIFNPVKDPTSSLPRAAPPPKPVVTSFSRQASQPSPFSSQPSFRSAHCPSPQLPPSPAGGTGPGDYPPNYRGAPSPRQSRITSPVSAFSPERVVSPRSGVQAPRPTFSAKKAGIEPQARKESPSTPTPTQTPTPSRTPQFTRRFSSPEGPCSGAWSPSPQGSQPSSITTTSRPLLISTATSPVSPPWETRCQSPLVYQPSQASSATSTSRPLYPSTATSPISTPRQTRCLSPNVSSLDSKANHRLLAKNIINAAKRKNSPSPGALSGHSLPISPLGGPYHQAYEHGKPPFSPFQSRALGAQSPPFASPPATPTRLIRSPVRLYNTRSLTDSDASVESEDSGLRSPGLRSYNTCPRGWGGSLRVKRGSVSTDL